MEIKWQLKSKSGPEELNAMIKDDRNHIVATVKQSFDEKGDRKYVYCVKNLRGLGTETKEGSHASALWAFYGAEIEIKKFWKDPALCKQTEAVEIGPDEFYEGFPFYL